MAELNQISVTKAELEAEHVHIHQAIEEWREWWEQLRQLGQPHFGEMGDKLVSFRNELAAHFTHEETSGPLVELSRKGTEQQQLEIRQLWKEHVAMLRELDDMIAKLKSCSPEVVCWGDAGGTFEEFLDRLNMHNEVEDRLLNQG